MDLVSRIRRDRLDERERGTRAMDKRKNRFPPRFYRSGRACLFRYRGSLLLVYR